VREELRGSRIDVDDRVAVNTEQREGCGLPENGFHRFVATIVGYGTQMRRSAWVCSRGGRFCQS
jgi:hypothetical protein